MEPALDLRARARACPRPRPRARPDRVPASVPPARLREPSAHPARVRRRPRLHGPRRRAARRLRAGRPRPRAGDRRPGAARDDRAAPARRRAADLLRLRTARLDYFVDTRRRGMVRDERRRRLVRGAAISRVRARYVPGANDILPATERIPATDPSVVCSGTVECLARQIFRTGRTFSVPGAFRLRVLRERSGDESSGRGRSMGVRIATRWLDRTPPSLTVAAARIVRPFGAPAELALDLRAAAAGAGVLRVEVEQDGSSPASQRMPCPGSSPARAAAARSGCRSSPAPPGRASGSSTRRATRPRPPPSARRRSRHGAGRQRRRRPAARRLGRGCRAAPARAGRHADRSRRPRRRGVRAGRIQRARHRRAANVPIQPDGTFAVTWRAPGPGLYAPRVKVPVGRAPDGLNLLYDVWDGFLRG